MIALKIIAVVLNLALVISALLYAEDTKEDKEAKIFVVVLTILNLIMVFK